MIVVAGDNFREDAFALSACSQSPRSVILVNYWLLSETIHRATKLKELGIKDTKSVHREKYMMSGQINTPSKFSAENK